MWSCVCWGGFNEFNDGDIVQVVGRGELRFGLPDDNSTSPLWMPLAVRKSHPDEHPRRLWLVPLHPGTDSNDMRACRNVPRIDEETTAANFPLRIKDLDHCPLDGAFTSG